MRRSNIELVRFLSCVGILLWHATILDGFVIHHGYLYVELFYMITGCFCMARIEKTKPDVSAAMQYSSQYTFQKLRKLLPYVVFGVVLCYIWRFIFVPPQRSEAISLLLKSPFELFLFNITGLSNVYLNAPMWYLSALMIALPLIMYMEIRFKDLFRYYLSWIIPAVVYGYYMIKFNGLNTWGNETVFLSGVLRAFAGLSMGSCSYCLALIIKDRLRDPKWSIIGGVSEIALYVMAVCFTAIPTDKADTGIVLLMFAAFTLSYSGITFTSALTFSCADYLGKLSGIVFCLHWGVFLFVQYLFPAAGFAEKLLLSLIIVFLVSVVLLKAYEALKRESRAAVRLINTPLLLL